MKTSSTKGGAANKSSSRSGRRGGGNKRQDTRPASVDPTGPARCTAEGSVQGSAGGGARRYRRDRPQHDRLRVPAASCSSSTAVCCSRKTSSPGVDLILPGLPAHRGPDGRRRGRGPHARPRGPHRRASRSCCACGRTSRSSARRFTLALVAAKCREHRQRPNLVEVAEGAAHRSRSVRVRVLRGQPLDPRRARRRDPHRRPASCCTPVTSSSTSCRSTAGSPTSPASPGSATRASTCSWSTPPTPRCPASSRPNVRSGGVLDNVIGKAKQRVIVASFASHVHRIQQVVDVAHRYNRRGRVRRPVDGPQHADRPGSRLPDGAGRPGGRHRHRRQPARRSAGAHLHRLAG